MAGKVQPPEKAGSPGPGAYEILQQQDGIYQKPKGKKEDRPAPLAPEYYLTTGQYSQGPFFNATKSSSRTRLHEGSAYEQADRLAEMFQSGLEKKEQPRWSDSSWKDLDGLHSGRESAKRRTHRT